MSQSDSKNPLTEVANSVSGYSDNTWGWIRFVAQGIVFILVCILGWFKMTYEVDSLVTKVDAMDSRVVDIEKTGVANVGRGNAWDSLESRLKSQMIPKDELDRKLRGVKDDVTANFKPTLDSFNTQQTRIGRIEDSLEIIKNKYVTSELVTSKIDAATARLELNLREQLDPVKSSIRTLQQTLNKLSLEASLDRFSDYAILTSKPQTDAEANKFFFVSFCSFNKAEVSIFRVVAADSNVVTYLTGLAKNGAVLRQYVPNANQTSEIGEEFGGGFLSGLDFDKSFALDVELDLEAYEKQFYKYEPSTKAIPKNIKTVGQLVRYFAQVPPW